MNAKTTDTLEIAAPAERVWAVLTDPELTQKYMFGCRTVSDWKLGSPLTWEGTFDGKLIVAVKGHIEKLQRPTLLQYSVFDPNGKYRDTPDNYLHVTYALTPNGERTTLTITQGDYSTVEDGEKRYADSAAGWGQLMQQIKTIAEHPSS